MFAKGVNECWRFCQTKIGKDEHKWFPFLTFPSHRTEANPVQFEPALTVFTFQGVYITAVTWELIYEEL